MGVEHTQIVFSPDGSLRKLLRAKSSYTDLLGLRRALCAEYMYSKMISLRRHDQE